MITGKESALVLASAQVVKDHMIDEVKKIPHYVKNITVHVDREIANGMIKFPEVNWSVVAREAIRQYIHLRSLDQKPFKL